MLFGLLVLLVVIVIPLPAINCTVSSPTATRLGCPVTCQVLNVLPNVINAFPDPRSVTPKPLVVSNFNVLTLEILFVTFPPVALLSATVKGDDIPVSKLPLPM